MSDRKQRIRKAITRRHLHIVEETDDAIIFRYQLNHIVVSQLDHPEPFIIISVPVIHQISSDKERGHVLLTCNALNANAIHTKFYIDEDDRVHIASESMIPFEDSDLSKFLKMSLDLLMAAKRRFMTLISDNDLYDGDNNSEIDVDDILSLPDDAIDELFGTGTISRDQNDTPDPESTPDPDSDPAENRN